jgi:L-alanine-DL-glutamate epimerase-like enolase superfamily enzyme
MGANASDFLLQRLSEWGVARIYGYPGDGINGLTGVLDRAGITGFMQAAALCRAFHIPLSAHCAPSIHAHPACAAPRLRHIEYFHDHVRIEHMLFDGALYPKDGALHPDLTRAGLGLEFKRSDAERYML